MTKPPKIPALDPMSIEPRKGSSYPEPWGSACGEREKRALGDALGLDDFGVNLVRLPPGAPSSQRHWHSHEDEFVYVLEGTLTLITDEGRQTLKPGMAAGFPSGKGDGHHVVNEGEGWAVYLEVGSRSLDDEVTYPDIDLFLTSAHHGKRRFTKKSGEPY
ncbi:MAG: cupin domain-containing protein [Kiloniellaceae bacterium]